MPLTELDIDDINALIRDYETRGLDAITCKGMGRTRAMGFISTLRFLGVEIGKPPKPRSRAVYFDDAKMSLDALRANLRRRLDAGRQA